MYIIINTHTRARAHTHIVYPEQLLAVSMRHDLPYIESYIHIYMYTQTHMYIYIYIYMYIYAHARIHRHTHIHARSYMRQGLPKNASY